MVRHRLVVARQNGQRWGGQWHMGHVRAIWIVLTMILTGTGKIVCCPNLACRVKSLHKFIGGSIKLGMNDGLNFMLCNGMVLCMLSREGLVCILRNWS